MERGRAQDNAGRLADYLHIRITSGWSTASMRSNVSIARAPALLAALALLHGLLFTWLVPPWQAPDEPTLFEYAALVARLGHIPTASYRDPALERQIVDSLVRQ